MGRISGSYSLGIDIDDTRYIRKDYGNFDYRHGESKLYGLFNNGDLIRWNDGNYTRGVIGWELKFKSGDRLTMELDLINEPKTLSYFVNNRSKQLAFDNIVVDKYIKYCMAMCCYHERNCVELLSYTSSDQ